MDPDGNDWRHFFVAAHCPTSSAIPTLTRTTDSLLTEYFQGCSSDGPMIIRIVVSLETTTKIALHLHAHEFATHTRQIQDGSFHDRVGVVH
jgi:hypothetical protein